MEDDERRRADIAAEGSHLDLLGVHRGNLRARSIVAGSKAVELTPEQELTNDIEFDTFSYVPPGFGQGPTNAIFQDNERHDGEVRYAGKLMQPREYQLPVPIRPIPIKFQNSVSDAVMNGWFKDAAKELLQEQMATRKVNASGGSMDVIPDDQNTISSATGAPGLPNAKYLRPAFNTTNYFMHAQLFSR